MSDTTLVIAALVREVLTLPEDAPIAPEQLLFYDLEFTSLDMVDLLFRIEEELGVEITEGTISELARGEMPEQEFCVDGVLTPAGRSRILELLGDAPASVFPERVHVQTLPRYCTIAALARLVDHQLGRR
jgi:acyl carrier protein